MVRTIPLSPAAAPWRPEVPRVLAELRLFREACLPAFFAGPASDLFAPDWGRAMRQFCVRKLGRREEWDAAAARLADALPLTPADAARPFRRERFEAFTYQPTVPGSALRGGRVEWRIELNVPVEMAAFAAELGGDSGGADPWEVFEERLAEAKKLIFAPPLDKTLWGDRLTVLLPFIADRDPAFARLALDLDTWRGAVASDRTCTERGRDRNRRAVEGEFGGVIEEALLNVMGAMANNQFLHLRELLDHPRLRSPYTHLMPHYLFAVLVEKVAALRASAAAEGAAA